MPVSHTKKDSIPRKKKAIIDSYFFLNANKPVIVSIVQIKTAISTVHFTK